MQIKFLAIALGVLAARSSAQAYQGFNYGSMKMDGSCQGYDGFKQLFERAKNLPGASDFTAVRLYTSVQCGTSIEPIEAYQAAIDTDTKILVGLWASAGHYVFENELKALMAAAATLGTAFIDRVIGISVGSEDLYRNSPEGIANNAGPGATAGEIQGYIGWARDWLRATPLENKPITHVDTWTAWILPESKVVIDSVDFLGHNSFPYFEGTRPNAITEASGNFWSALGATENVAQGKDVWVTETGWPDTGPTLRDAVPSVENAKTYWNTIGCSLFGKRNTFCYVLPNGRHFLKHCSYHPNCSLEYSRFQAYAPQTGNFKTCVA
ncbi:glycoside hydrolase family 17 protein [Xylaria acuta]|nr:glycoside hydrolase family 17 protein [Xylaria acuta]